MLTIGVFSKLCLVTPKTLRHYDRIGLLRPALFNSETGYRYYEKSQITDMLYILELKKYGFSLEEIKKLLRTDGMELAESMKKRYAELALEIETQKNLLAKMQTHIINLEKGINRMKTDSIDIKLVNTIDTNVLSVRETIAIRDFGKLMGEAMDLLAKSGAVCTGAPIAIYHSPEFDPEKTDIEIGVPVNAAGSNTRLLKGATCATAIHRGEYSTLHETYMRLGAWIDTNGYTIADSPYERYLNNPDEVPPEQLITEVYFPIAK